MIRMSARADVVAQYFNRKYIQANSGFLKQAVVGPDEACVLIRNGKIDDIATQEKLKGLSGGIVNWFASKLGGGEDLNLLFVVTSPIDIQIPLGSAIAQDGQAVADPSSTLITKDGQRLFGVTTIRISLDPNNASKVINLMSSLRGRGFELTGAAGERGIWNRQDAGEGVSEINQGQLITKFRDELLAKVYIPQARQYKAEDVRGSPDFTKDTDAMATSEMRKTFDLFGVTVLQAFTRWDPGEFEQLQMKIGQIELENRKKDADAAAAAGDQTRAYGLRQQWEDLEKNLKVVQEKNRREVEGATLEWELEKQRRILNDQNANEVSRAQARVQIQKLEADFTLWKEKQEDIQDAEQIQRLTEIKKGMKSQDYTQQMELAKLQAQVEMQKAQMDAEKAKHNVETYDRAMDKALGHAERTAALNAGMMGAAKANVPTTVVTGSSTAFTTVPAGGVGAAVAPSVGLKCPKCGDAVQPGWKVCPNCASPLGPAKCHGCGGEVQAKWKACPNCGAALGGG